MPELPFFRDLVLVIAAALVGGAAAQRLGQPPILGYLVGGILISPYTPGPVSEIRHVATLADIGVVLLMFELGVEFPVARLRRVRAVAIGGGLLQVVLTGVVAMGVARTMGFPMVQQVFFGAIVALSSADRRFISGELYGLLRREGQPCLFGDANNLHILTAAGVERANLLAITHYDAAAAEATITAVLRLHPSLKIIARVRRAADLQRLRSAGASEVVMPEFEAGMEFLRWTLGHVGLTVAEGEAIIQRRRSEFKPSETIGDPTIRRCRERAERLGSRGHDGGPASCGNGSRAGAFGRLWHSPFRRLKPTDSCRPRPLARR